MQSIGEPSMTPEKTLKNVSGFHRPIALWAHVWGFNIDVLTVILSQSALRMNKGEKIHSFEVWHEGLFWPTPTKLTVYDCPKYYEKSSMEAGNGEVTHVIDIHILHYLLSQDLMN